MEVTLWGYAVEIDAGRIVEPPGELVRQIREYQRGERRTFGLTVTYPSGFTGRVMRAMAAIPYGETRTYGEVAKRVDNSPIAVGQACGRNPVPLVVPCHRVVGASGVGGFSAAGGVDLKRRLLGHERSRGQATLAAYDEG
jgi:methylated-DNA-[protein]-cysteine S-methyltransferase